MIYKYNIFSFQISIILTILIYNLFLFIAIKKRYKPYRFWSQFMCDISTPKHENRISIVCYIIANCSFSVGFYLFNTLIGNIRFTNLIRLFTILICIAYIGMSFVIFELHKNLHYLFVFILFFGIIGWSITIYFDNYNPILLINMCFVLISMLLITITTFLPKQQRIFIQTKIQKLQFLIIQLLIIIYMLTE